MYTPDIAKESYRRLVTLFPGTVIETKDGEGNVVRVIDKDVLMQKINAQVIGDKQERYQFTWPGKRKSVVLTDAPIAKTLRFEKEKSAGRDRTLGGTNSENIYIEGDNLDMLELLQEMYLDKVKMICVDPPYNTGSGFVYRDSFNIDADEYGDNSGQTDEDGNQLVQNPESNGGFRTDWFNMLYPRIRIVKDLLSEEGLILISMGDNKQQNLGKICDEIFGEGDFVATFIWEKRKTRENRKVIPVRRDCVVCYSRNYSERDQALGLEETSKDAIGRYKNPDDDSGGPWTSVPAVAQGGHGTKFQFYTFEFSSGKEFDPPSSSCWRMTQPKVQETVADNRTWFGEDRNNVPQIEKFMMGGKRGLTPESVLTADFVGTNDSAKRGLVSLFDGLAAFETPKPVGLIQHFISVTARAEDGIFLDLFSRTTAPAQTLFEQNVRDNIK